jgi:hypothetical protein
MPDGNLGGNGAINFNWEGNNWASISSSESTLNLYSLSVVNSNPKTNVRIGDNVELTTNLLDSAYTWTFGSDAILSLPQNLSVGAAVIQPNASTFGLKLISNGNTWTFGTNGFLTFPVGEVSIGTAPDTQVTYFGSGVDGGGSISFSPTGNTYIVGSQNTVIDAGFGSDGPTQHWTFGTDGSLEFPAGYILPNTIGAPGQVITLGGQGGTYWESPLSIGNTIPALQNFWYNTNDGRLYVKANDVWVDANPQVPQETFSGDYNDLTNLPDTGPFDRLIAGDKSVILGTDGQLTLPANIVGNSVIYSSTGNVELYTNHSGDASVKIRAKGDGGDSVWSFRSDGAITLPAYGTIDSIDGIKLVTDRGTLVIGTQLETPGVAQHFHIAFDGSNSTPNANDLFLGDDYNYVKLPGYALNPDAQYGVEIGTKQRGGPQNVVVDAVDELVPPGGVWRLFIIIADYPTLGSNISVGDTVTTSWGTPITATITGVVEAVGDGDWQIQVDQDITAGFDASVAKTVSFGTSGNSYVWRFGTDGDLLFPAGYTLPTTLGEPGEVITKLGQGATRWSSTLSTGDTVPDSQNFWYNTDDGRLYVKANDIWVDANPEVPQYVPTEFDRIVSPNGLHATVIDNTGTTTSGGDILPGANTYNLGSSANPWKDVFVSKGSIVIADQDINTDAVLISNTAGYLQLSRGGFKVVANDNNHNIFELYNTGKLLLKSEIPLIADSAAFEVIGNLLGESLPISQRGVMIHSTGAVNVPNRMFMDAAGVQTTGSESGLAAYPAYIGRSSRGTVADPQPIQAGDIITRFGGFAWAAGLGLSDRSNAQIDMVASETQSLTNRGTKIEIRTTANGTATNNVLWTFDNDGGLVFPDTTKQYTAGMIYKGSWNANTNTPTLSANQAGAVRGDVYITSTAGTRNIGSGSQEYYAGDLLIYDGTHWNNIPGNTGSVTSFNTRTGVVTLTSTDVTTALGYTPLQYTSLSAETLSAGVESLTYNNSTGKFSLTPYLLPTASTTQLGGVKVDGTTITINAGVISSTGTGTVIFKGSWNASTNTPTLSANQVGAQSGWEYIVTVAGTRNLGNGSVTFNVGDLVIYDGTTWNDIPGNAATVASFNTRTGAVTLQSNDVTTALGFTPIQLSSLSVGTPNSASGSGAISYNNATGEFKYTPPVVYSTLASLTDVNTTGVINNQVLTYSTASSKWVAATPAVAPTYTVSTGSASGGGSLSLSGTTFTFNPAVQYTLPTASASVLGGVKVGAGLSIDSGTGILSSTITQYTDALARASLSAGTGISYNSSTGVITNTITQYTDALARGAISVSGSLSYNSSTGVISYTTPTYTITTGSASGGGALSLSGTTFTFNPAVQYTLPTASTSVLGGVKVDGTTITINGSGVIQANYSTTLAGLTDTNVSGASNNQVLTWNTSTSKWIPTTVNGVSTLPTGIAYYGSFYDSGATQTATSLTTAYVVRIASTAESNGVTIASNNRITFAYAGTYEIQFSIQFKNEDTKDAEVDVWFRKNGTDIAESNSIFTATSKQNGNGYLIAVTPYLITVAAGDYVQIVWSSDNTVTTIVTTAAQTNPTVPITPGVIVLVNPVTALIVPTTVESLTVTGATSTGSLTVTNTITGSVSGNAATATKLATARNINGVAFDGTAAITVTADATTLTGATLKSTVVNSSLTSVGTLTSLTSAGTVIFTDTTNSTNTTTGALQVRGGVGVAGNIYLGGGINATGSIYSAGTNVTYAPVNPTGQAFQATGKDTQGGTGYFDFFKISNTTSGVTNGSKTMRLNSVGTLEILNNAYNATILSITDTGFISINASSSATDGVPTNNGIAMNANSYIFDDGNYHITAKTGNIWLNSNSGGTVNINTQMPSGVTGGGLVSQGAVKSNAAGAAGTAFIAGAGAISGVALQLDSGTAGTAAQMAIRDTSTVASTMYFDVSTGGTPNGTFRWRSSSSFTELMSLSSTQLTINEAVTMGGSTATAYLSVIGSKTYSITGYGYLGTGGAGTVGGNSGNVAYGIYCANRIQSGEVDVTSDERAKDIQGTIPLDKALQFVRAVDGILYTWKPGFGDDGLKSGFSAQGVHKAGFDHMVGHIPNENLAGDVDDDGWTHPDKFQLTMGYNQAIPYHHEVIKHLLDRIEQLEATVAKLSKNG